jgi:hypothetical protein
MACLRPSANRSHSVLTGGVCFRGSSLNPEGEQYLDWFHITMRITVLGQYAKGLDTALEKREQAMKILESTKHYLWHGNVVRA